MAPELDDAATPPTTLEHDAARYGRERRPRGRAGSMAGTREGPPASTACPIARGAPRRGDCALPLLLRNDSGLVDALGRRVVRPKGSPFRGLRRRSLLIRRPVEEQSAKQECAPPRGEEPRRARRRTSSHDGFTWPRQSLKTRRAETCARVPARSAVQKADRSEGERAKGELANPKVDRRVTTTRAFGRQRLAALTPYNATRRDPTRRGNVSPQRPQRHVCIPWPDGRTTNVAVFPRAQLFHLDLGLGVDNRVVATESVAPTSRGWYGE